MRSRIGAPASTGPWLGVVAAGAALVGAARAEPLLDRPVVALGWYALLVVGCAAAAARADVAGPRALLAAVVGLRLLGLFGTPTLSDDVHRYVHEGRASRVGLAVPYATPPSSITPPPDDGTTGRVNHPDVPAAYPPLTQLALLAAVGAGDLVGAPRAPLRLLLVLCDLVVVLALRRRGGRAWARYGLHPLPLVEVAVSAHVDALGVALLVGAVLLAARPLARGALVGLACGVKPVAALALVAERRATLPVVVLGVALGVALPALPHVVAGAPLGAGLVEYGTRWRAAPFLYAVVEGALAPTYEARAARRVWMHAHVSSRGVLVEENGVAVLAVGDARPVARKILLDGSFWARALCGLALAAILVVVVRRVRDVDARVAWAFAALWLCAPTVHPWYLLWPLPFAILVDARGIVWFATAAPLCYEAAARLRATGTWDESLWPRAIMLAALVAGTALDVRRRRAAAAIPSPAAAAPAPSSTKTAS